MVDTLSELWFNTSNAPPNAQNGLAQSGNLVMRRDAAVPRYGGSLFNKMTDEYRLLAIGRCE